MKGASDMVTVITQVVNNENTNVAQVVNTENIVWRKIARKVAKYHNLNRSRNRSQNVAMIVDSTK